MSASAQDKLVQLLSRRLRGTALGALSMLNNLAFKKYRTDFASLLITDPLKAYEVLLEYAKGDKRRARLFLRSILVVIIPPSKLLQVIDALERGDPGPLIEEINAWRKKAGG